MILVQVRTAASRKVSPPRFIADQNRLDDRVMSQFQAPFRAKGGSAQNVINVTGSPRL